MNNKYPKYFLLLPASDLNVIYKVESASRIFIILGDEYIKHIYIKGFLKRLRTQGIFKEIPASEVAFLL